MIESKKELRRQEKKMEKEKRKKTAKKEGERVEELQVSSSFRAKEKEHW